MKVRICILLSVILFVFASMRPPASSDLSQVALLPDTAAGMSPLVKYGEYVFNIENCNRCHTLEKFENEDLVSLDGMANKYTPSWHYSHLVDPASMVIDSKMPSFGRLADREMDKSLFLKLSNSFGDHDWEKLNAESELLYGVIQPAIGNIPRRSELLALIAFLESIPMSPELEAFVSVENAKMAIRQQGWDQYVGSQGSSVYQMKPDKKMIESGSEIYRKYSCGACHGMSGEGMLGPNLTDNYWLHGNSTHDIVTSIAYGWPANGMKPWKFDMDTSEVAPLVAYIRSLYGTNPANAKAPQGDEK